MTNPKIYETGVVYYFWHNDVVKYIGSTVDFKRRLKRHKHCCYNTNSGKTNYPLYQYIRETGIWNKFQFKIEFTYHNITLKELEKHEADRILEFGIDNLFNTVVPGRTGKEWRMANEKILKLKNKKWRTENEAKLKLDKKKYYKDNKDKILSKDWYCDVCDNTTKNAHKSRHIKTARHQSNLQSNLLHLAPNIFN